MTFESFPSIEQFRTVVKNVRHHHSFYPDGERVAAPVFPVRKYVGTVKLHGTNAGIYFHHGEIKYMSRSHWIDKTNDNMWFANFMSQYEHGAKYGSTIRELVDQLNRRGYHMETASGPTIFYGEWCGHVRQKGVDISIQKGVGISEVDQMFVIFRVKVGDTWVPIDDMRHIRLPEFHIFNIFEFPTFELEIDFNAPELVQNKLIEITNAVEAECPVAKAFGVSGVGEGVVWTPLMNSSLSRTFKVKGAKHSVTKVKTLVEVDVQKMATVADFATVVVTENRLAQGIEYLKSEGLDDADIRNMGKYLKWLANDIFKEERDRMVASELNEKDVGRKISDIGKRWYMDRLEAMPLNTLS